GTAFDTRTHRMATPSLVDGLHITLGRLDTLSNASGCAILVPAEPARAFHGRDRIERRQPAIVELEAHRRPATAGAAQRVVPPVERIGERDFGVALGDDAECRARFPRVRADVAAVHEEERLLGI